MLRVWFFVRRRGRKRRGKEELRCSSVSEEKKASQLWNGGKMVDAEVGTKGSQKEATKLKTKKKKKKGGRRAFDPGREKRE